MLCRLQTASMFGRMQVDIMRASMCTATRSVVQTAKVTSISLGTFVSEFSWTSTMATWKNDRMNENIFLWNKRERNCSSQTYHGESGEQSRSFAGCLELRPAELKLSPSEVSRRVQSIARLRHL